MTRIDRRPPALLLATLLIAAACDSEPTQPAPKPSPVAEAYLDHIIDLMEANSIKRLEIDWDSFRASVLAEAAGAQSIEDTYPAIEVALTLLGDGHSSYRTAHGTVIFVPTRSCGAPRVESPTLPATIGYVRIRAFSGSAGATTATEFANGIQRAIEADDRDDLIGWIVDLRGNSGGNMWPMLAGVGPVLGEGVVGYFIDPVGAESVWEYRDGASWLAGSVVQQVDTPYRLRRERPRVAVLTDRRVASSGEAIAIAFRQRPDTRSFGTSTCGLSTANAGFGLNDGAVLILTVSVMADRSKAKYGNSIEPDETIADPDDAVQRAVEWLQSESDAAAAPAQTARRSTSVSRRSPSRSFSTSMS